MNNVTIPTWAISSPVENPTVKWVMRSDTEETVSSEKILTIPHGEVGELRLKVATSIERGNPMFVCPFCRGPLTIAMSLRKRPYFKHRSGSNGKIECSVIEIRGMTEEQILAEKFNGVKESEEHKAFKRMVIECLEIDPSFSEISGIQERVWRSNENAKVFRRPDIQAFMKSGETHIRVAFEVQLSTTFLSVIVGRREFYRSEGGLVTWILPDFNPLNRRQTDDDVLYSNNRNVLVVNQETMRVSRNTGKFYVFCWYQQVGDESLWHCKMVEFSALQIDMNGQRAFYYDYDFQKTFINEAAKDDTLKKRALALAQDPDEWRNLKSVIEDLQTRLDFKFRHDYEFEREFYCGLKALYSASHGFPIGFGYPGLNQVGRKIETDAPQFMGAFLNLCRKHGHTEALKSKASPNWYQERKYAMRGVGGDGFIMDYRMKPLFEFLFPELKSN